MGPRISVSHLADLMRYCINSKSYLTGKTVHALIIRFEHSDAFLFNRLIELYSKCGHTGTACRVFDKMPERNLFCWNAMLGAYCKDNNLRNAYSLFLDMPERDVVSWSTMIAALVRNGHDRDALKTYAKMISEGFIPSNFTLASLFSACGSLLAVECGMINHCLLVKIGLGTNIYVVNALLGMYAKCGLIKEAIEVFNNISHPNEVSFTTMMVALGQTNKIREAFELFKLMRIKGICIDSVSLSSILGVCAKSGNEDVSLYDFSGLLEGEQLHALSLKLGFQRDLHLSNSLLDVYAKSGNMDSAEKFFTHLVVVSVVSWNIMISMYGKKSCVHKAMKFMQQMQYHGFEPDEVTYVNMLAACVRSGNVDTGRQIFDNMSSPSTVSWNVLLSGYSQNGKHEEALELFRNMQFQDLQPDKTTLATILSSCATMGLLKAGEQVHAISEKVGFERDLYIASGLIGMYSKCGKIKHAEKVFYDVPHPDIVCCNSMMLGFSLNSLYEKALTFFKQIRETGLFPSEFSYASILSSCADLPSLFLGQQVHAVILKDGYVDDIFVGSGVISMYCKCGEVDKARQCFDLMPSTSTVTWNEMIHGYAQNGLGVEALCLYRNMITSREKPDGITFLTVLTACSHSGLVDEGLEIFKSMDHIFGVNPILDHYTCIIDSLGRAGRLHEAEVLLENSPCRNDPVVWEVFLSSCRLHDNVSLAKKAAEELSRLDPQNSAPYVLLGNAYSSLGRWDDARSIRELMSQKEISKDTGFSWSECRNVEQGSA